MDQMLLAAAWISLGNGLRRPYGMDSDIEVLLAQRDEPEPPPSLRLDLAIGLAELLEGFATRLRGATGRLSITHV